MASQTMEEDSTFASVDESFKSSLLYDSYRAGGKTRRGSQDGDAMDIEDGGTTQQSLGDSFTQEVAAS